jgi:hypothetical protein
LIDSAGIRESEDVVESIGINKAKEALNSADIVLYIVDGSVELDNEDLDIISTIKDKNTILVVNKSDLTQIVDLSGLPFDKKVCVSTKTGYNIETLKEMLLDFVVSRSVNTGAFVLTNTRHIEAVKRAVTNTNRALRSVQEDMINLDLVSIDINPFKSFFHFAIVIKARVVQFNCNDAQLTAFLKHAQYGGSGHTQIISYLLLVHIILIVQAADLVDQPLIIYDFFHLKTPFSSMLHNCYKYMHAIVLIACILYRSPLSNATISS